MQEIISEILVINNFTSITRIARMWNRRCSAGFQMENLDLPLFGVEIGG